MIINWTKHVVISNSGELSIEMALPFDEFEFVCGHIVQVKITCYASFSRHESLQKVGGMEHSFHSVIYISHWLVRHSEWLNRMYMVHRTRSNWCLFTMHKWCTRWTITLMNQINGISELNFPWKFTQSFFHKSQFNNHFLWLNQQQQQQNARRNDKFADVLLFPSQMDGGYGIPAHKIILSSCSHVCNNSMRLRIFSFKFQYWIFRNFPQIDSFLHKSLIQIHHRPIHWFTLYYRPKSAGDRYKS